MPNKTYSEKLKDPRWQRKRLQILERDNFECQSCGDTKSQLHIHHREYKNVNPWEYDNESLITVCEDCHKSITESISKVRTYVSQIANAEEAKMVENIMAVVESIDIYEMRAIELICSKLILMNKDSRHKACKSIINNLSKPKKP